MRTLATVLLSLTFLGGTAIAGTKKDHVIYGLEWRELTAAELALLKQRDVPILMPPTRYDYFNPNVRIVFMSPDEVHQFCASFWKGPFKRTLKACAYPEDSGDNKCVIVMPNQSPYQTAFLRHEMGHCNGWAGNHPR